MEELDIDLIKEIFENARQKGVFYPGLYEAVMLAYKCGLKKQHLVGLKTGDLVNVELKERISVCGNFLGRYLKSLQKDGKLNANLPLFSRYYPNKERQFNKDLREVCLCACGKSIKYNDFIRAGMKNFHSELDESMPKSEKYKQVARQYEYKDLNHIGKIINGYSKHFHTNESRLRNEINRLSGSYFSENNLSYLEKQIWKILYYAYHRDRKKGDKPQEWYVKKCITPLCQ